MSGCKWYRRKLAEYEERKRQPLPEPTDSPITGSLQEMWDEMFPLEEHWKWLEKHRAKCKDCQRKESK